eukprot:14445302-Alexandrium_andersonii.AAC.1
MAYCLAFSVGFSPWLKPHAAAIKQAYDFAHIPHNHMKRPEAMLGSLEAIARRLRRLEKKLLPLAE